MRPKWMLMLFLCVPYLARAMVSRAIVIKNCQEKIKYNGQEKSIAELVKQSRLNGGLEAFSVTQVVDCRGQHPFFVKRGDLLSLTDKDVAQIEQNNFIYASFFGYEKTRLSKGRYEAVGALLIGTNREVLLNHPSFYRLRTLAIRLEGSKL